MTPRVTVVIPVWDSYVRWLDEAVASVLDQQAGAEVIVVDNASTVPVAKIPGTRLVRSEVRVTTGAARNLGLEMVTTPLVVFLDVDDLMLPGSLESLVSGIRTNPNAVAYAMSRLDGDTGRRHRSPRRIAYRLARVPRLFALATTIWSLLPTQGSTIMRTRDVRAAGGYVADNRTQGEDWALAMSLAWRGRICFATSPALLYRWRPDSPGRAASPSRVIANARDVRRRVLDDRAIPATTRRLVGVIAAGQWMAIWVVRPAFRAFRRLRR